VAIRRRLAAKKRAMRTVCGAISLENPIICRRVRNAVEWGIERRASAELRAGDHEEVRGIIEGRARAVNHSRQRPLGDEAERLQPFA
jgi:hypothetical protein